MDKNAAAYRFLLSFLSATKSKSRPKCLNVFPSSFGHRYHRDHHFSKGVRTFIYRGGLCLPLFSGRPHRDRGPRPCSARASSVTGTAIFSSTKPEPRRFVHTFVNS